MDALDLAGISGVSQVLVVHTSQQSVYSWDHILPLWPPHKCYIYGKFINVLQQFKITNGEPLIIQDTFLGIPVTGNSIQHAVTYVHFSQFIANKTFHEEYHNASG